MGLIEQIKSELSRGFSKSELERIWDLPKNSLSAVLSDNVKVKKELSKKGLLRVEAYFATDPINRPDPSPRIGKGTKPKDIIDTSIEARNAILEMGDNILKKEKELNKDEVGDKGFTMVNIPEITFENMGIRDLATKADKQSKKSSKKDTPVPSDPNNPTSLADMFKGRNINQRTYKHPKS